MRNTNIALNIIFLDANGEVLNSELGRPRQERLIACDDNCKYVIEIPA